MISATDDGWRTDTTPNRFRDDRDEWHVSHTAATKKPAGTVLIARRYDQGPPQDDARRRAHGHLHTGGGRRADVAGLCARGVSSSPRGTQWIVEHTWLCKRCPTPTSLSAPPLVRAQPAKTLTSHRSKASSPSTTALTSRTGARCPQRLPPSTTRRRGKRCPTLAGRVARSGSVADPCSAPTQTS
jgi:hypothetical protein